MTKCIILSLAICSTFLRAAIAGEAAHVTLSPGLDNTWRADFKLESPTKSLKVIRPSGGSRIERWRLPDPDFEFVALDDDEVIRRKDGEPFTDVSVLEPATYNKPKGYLAFAPFGDGGVLIHTGRFHACAGDCPLDDTGDEGPWRFTVDPGDATQMIVLGAIASGPTSFVDKGDGTKVYVGDASIVEGPSLLAVIDASLPEDIHQSLNVLFRSSCRTLPINLAICSKNKCCLSLIMCRVQSEGPTSRAVLWKIRFSCILKARK